MAPEPTAGHIFLSHASADTPAARHLAEILRRANLSVWFDQDSIPPGAEWQSTLEHAIARASAMIVYIGSMGIHSWVEREVRYGLVRNTRDCGSFRFIPVLGEGADVTMLPPFVQQQQCIDIRDSAQIHLLIDALHAPLPSQHSIPSQYWTTHTPFRSLQVFTPEDAWLFFGRDRDTADLVKRLHRAPALAVVGNSGSGKSSLIQAGLIPALRRAGPWRIAVFRPSESPFDYLAESLPCQLAPNLTVTERAEFTKYCKRELPESAKALRNIIASLVTSTTDRVLLVADQFEELFALVADKSTRALYVDSLLAAARFDAPVPVHLLLALRADFYANCLDHPGLSRVLDASLSNIPRISPPQLREAIDNRLALAAASAEPGLIDSLLADVGDEPGNLALLEHALAQLWDHSTAILPRRMTTAAYTEIGRLRGAIGKHADQVYLDLPKTDQTLAQRIFLEMVQLGEGAQDTCRRVAKREILHLASPEQVERIIAHLVSHRLLTTSTDHIEVSHEALIREWPRLQHWLKDNREDLRLGRTILQSIAEWQELDRDTSALLQGPRLSRTQEWRARHQNAPPLVDQFLDASTNARRVQEEAFARQKLESIGTLASGIAHDFNNLLGGVLAQAELGLAELADGSNPVAELNAIRDVAVRGSEIVRQLMVYAGKESPVVELVDVSKVIAEMLQLIKVSVSKHAVIEATLGKDLPPVRANASQLRQLVLNLVTNASEAIGDLDGVIRVSVGRVNVARDARAISNRFADGDCLQLEVSDTGQGMSLETQAKVFEPFFTSKSTGHGLGLAVVHGIVRGLGGSIDLLSALGKGTTFKILLPFAETSGLPTSDVVVDIEETILPPQPRTILIVEDEVSLRQGLGKMLRQRGFEVFEAEDGFSAISLLRTNAGRIEVILLDLTIPGASSQEVVAEAAQLRPSIRVILTSAYSHEMTTSAMKAPQVRSFIRKPFRFDDLGKTLENVLSADS